MSADLAYTSGELSTEGCTLENVTLTENWWQKYGRIVEFQIVYTGSGFSTGSMLAKGLPRAAISDTYIGLASCYNVKVSNTTGEAYIESIITASGTEERILHGIYISES